MNTASKEKPLKDDLGKRILGEFKVQDQMHSTCKETPFFNGLAWLGKSKPEISYERWVVPVLFPSNQSIVLFQNFSLWGYAAARLGAFGGFSSHGG